VCSPEQFTGIIKLRHLPKIKQTHHRA
jgi:hypothetical protein